MLRNISEAAAGGAMAKMGIKVKPELDLPAMQAQRHGRGQGLTGGIEFLFKKNKIDWLKGHAAFKDAHTVEVAGKSVTREEHRHRDRLVGHAAARCRRR